MECLDSMGCRIITSGSPVAAVDDICFVDLETAGMFLLAHILIKKIKISNCIVVL